MRNILKRLIGLALCTIMVCSMVGFEAPIMAAPGGPTITVSSASRLPGEEVTIVVSVDENSNITSGTFDMVFDSSLLTFKSASISSGFLPMPFSSATLISPGNIRIMLISTNGAIVNPIALITLTFEISPDATPGTIPLDLHVASGGVTDPNYNLITVNIINGSITIPAPMQENISIDPRIIIEVASIPSANDLEFNPQFRLTAKSEITLILCVASYDVNGRMVAINTQSVSMIAGTKTGLQASIPYTNKGLKYNFFVWDSNYKPLTRITTITDNKFKWWS